MMFLSILSVWVEVVGVRMGECDVHAAVSGAVLFQWVLSAHAVPGPVVTAGSVA